MEQSWLNANICFKFIEKTLSHQEREITWTLVSATLAFIELITHIGKSINKLRYLHKYRKLGAVLDRHKSFQECQAHVASLRKWLTSVEFFLNNFFFWRSKNKDIHQHHFLITASLQKNNWLLRHNLFVLITWLLVDDGTIISYSCLQIHRKGNTNHYLLSSVI